ncbi:MAG TPA: Hpt domain-containing protein, partial [Polyangia bacterium]|nr:Hpt domain-containing protein [Polyangia bacterium]
MSEWDPDELRELRAFFLDEADEHLGEIAAELARLGAQAGDGDVVTSLLRLLHTLKGSAGSVELPDVARAAHAIEDRLVALRAAPSPGEL